MLDEPPEEGGGGPIAAGPALKTRGVVRSKRLAVAIRMPKSAIMCP
jgi:hypothetical protein